MTRPHRKAWLVRLARRYVRSRLRRAFDGVHLAGLDAIRALVEHQPIIVAANHSAWWDPLVAVLVDELLGTEGYCLMDAANLRRLPFFGWLGALPLDGSSPRAALGGLRTGISLLDRPGRLLWVFPQGRQRPAHLRPLGLRPGVALLASRSGAPVVPLGLRYDFRESHKPELNIWLGAPMAAPEHHRGAFLETLEQRLVEALDRIDGHLLSKDPAFETFIGGNGQPTVPLAGRALALIGRVGRDDD